MLAMAIFCVLIGCSEDELIRRPPVSVERSIKPVADSLNVADTTKTIVECSACTYVVPAGQRVIDGKELDLQPGSVIGLSSAIPYGTLEFVNIVGTKENPIIIKNCGGTARIKATDRWHAVRTTESKYFKITGGTSYGIYGINIQGGEVGLKMDGLSTNFEVDHVEISNVSFAGVMAKTDPSCDDATIRGNFTMYDVSLHDNYIHETGGEGFYVGNSFYDGMERSCGKRLPHEIKGLKIYNNILKDTGWEGIQVGCAIEGAEIYNNTVKNFGTANVLHQNNGIQIGSGTGGLLYNNFVKDGPGNGLIILGIGDNVIYNNIIVNAGSSGIFADERNTPGEGFKFINNTILSPKLDGIRLYTEKVPMNVVVNNIISNPGTYGSYSGNRSSDDAFVYLLNSDVKVQMENNLFQHTLEETQFINPNLDNYRLKPTSPAINIGKDISSYEIAYDFYQGNRLKGTGYDIGASEY